MTENVLSGIKEVVSPEPVKIVGVLTPEIRKLAERLKLANAAAAAAKKEQKFCKDGLLLEIACITGFPAPESLPLGSQVNVPEGVLFEVDQQIRLNQSSLKAEEPETFERFSGPTRELKFKPLV